MEIIGYVESNADTGEIKFNDTVIGTKNKLLTVLDHEPTDEEIAKLDPGTKYIELIALHEDDVVITEQEYDDLWDCFEQFDGHSCEKEGFDSWNLVWLVFIICLIVSFFFGK